MEMDIVRFVHFAQLTEDEVAERHFVLDGAHRKNVEESLIQQLVKLFEAGTGCKRIAFFWKNFAPFA
jgi:hypothetical protein